MRKLLAIASVGFAFALPAYAADLSVAYKAPPAPYSWTGFYIGANLGGGYAQANDAGTLLTAAGATIAGSQNSSSTGLGGVIGGGQLGYNLQAGKLVLGIEGDFDGSSQTGTSSLASALGTTFTSHQENWFSTVRGRLGWAADRWLFFVTGGVAFENLGHSTTLASTSGASVPIGGETVTRTGYTVGAGVEAALWGNWTGAAEYLYIDTGNFTTSITPSAAFLAAPGVPAGVATATDTQRFQNSILRVKLNYRF
jgi:outer membrane immunogenic protein